MEDEEETQEEGDIEESLEDLNIWGIRGSSLVTRVEFESYRDACFFANQVFALTEQSRLSTRTTVDSGGVNIDIETDGEGPGEQEFELAETIEDSLSGIEWE